MLRLDHETIGGLVLPTPTLVLASPVTWLFDEDLSNQMLDVLSAIASPGRSPRVTIPKSLPMLCSPSASHSSPPPPKKPQGVLRDSNHMLAS